MGSLSMESSASLAGAALGPLVRTTSTSKGRSMQTRRFIGMPAAVGALAVVAAVWPGAVSAQEYPSRAVTVVVPFAAGGSFDVVARIVTARMQEIVGQPVVVENVGGGGGTTGVKRVMASPPDGYTVLFGTIGTHAYNQTIYRNRRYDAAGDFTP